MQTISFFYDDYKKVQNVLAELQKFDVAASATKLVACDADERYRAAPLTHTIPDDAMVGAAIGGVAGLVAGAMAAMGSLEAPGLEALATMGLMTTSAAGGLGGALIGWLSGSLTHLIYAKSGRPGSGTLISVHTSDEQAGFVETIMRRGLATNPSTRLGDYLETGWAKDASPRAVAPLAPRFHSGNLQS